MKEQIQNREIQITLRLGEAHPLYDRLSSLSPSARRLHVKALILANAYPLTNNKASKASKPIEQLPKEQDTPASPPKPNFNSL
jgi:hypothetical protein